MFFVIFRYEMSAMYYAMTKASFEEVALKFVQLDDSHALKTFLLKVTFLVVFLDSELLDSILA